MTIKNLHDKVLGDTAKDLLQVGKDEYKTVPGADIEQQADVAKKQLDDIYSFVDVFEKLLKKLEQPPQDDKSQLSTID